MGAPASSARVLELRQPVSGSSTSYPIRGRDVEIESAVDVLRHTANSGQSGVVLLTGEPGIGKTALLGAIAERARGLSFGVGVSKAEELHQIAPLAPLLVALRSGSVPILSRSEFNELAPLCRQPLWLVDRLTGMLEKRASAAPLLIGIDDLQWADALSIFALRVMPIHLAGCPIVWLLATRSRPAHPAKEIRAALAADLTISEINVGPLTPEAIDELALDRHGERPRGRLRQLLQDARGYPFLAVELLDGISRDGAARGREAPHVRELPDRLIAGVRSRLETLSEDSLRLLQVASIFGRSFYIEEVAELLHVMPWTLLIPSIQAAVGAGVLSDDGDRLAFRHDLLRQAVYEDVPQSMRIILHRAAAQRALAAGRGALEAAPHVLIYAERGDRQAIDVLRAAANALTVTMPSVAAQLIERAFSLLETEDASWVETGNEAIAILTAAQRAKEAITVADTILSANITGEAAAAVQARVARTLWTIGQPARMRERIRAAFELSGVTERTRAELSALKALVLAGEGDWSNAARSGERALDAARRLKIRSAEADALRALGEAARNNGRHDTALAYFREWRGIDEFASPADELLSLQLLDRYDVSGTLLEQVRAHNDGRCDASKAIVIGFAQMWHDYGLGMLDETEADAETLLQLCDDLREHGYALEARIMLSRVAQLRGEFDVARAHLATAATDPNAADDSRALMIALMAAWLAHSEGAAATALDHVRGVVRRTRNVRHRWFWQPAWLVTAARVAVLGRDLDLARDVASHARSLAELNPNVATIAGIAAHVEGLVHGDLHHLALADDVLRSSPRALIRADAAYDFGRLAVAAGRRDAGLSALDRAWEIFDRHGAYGEVRNVERLMQTAGLRRRRWAPARPRPLEGWAALTATEERVARLIAQGHTNRSAAQHLVLSPNTVATHLRSIFAKLAVNSRSQLTRVVMSQPPPKD